MAIDLYGPCPCGSGKKFKWCCQPIHVSIDKAFRQDADGQHEAALRVMDEVVREHPSNPEAWGRQAQLLYQNDKVEEAEAALEKAFSVNPQYPFGFLLRGMFRHNESEFTGALLLFRKAAEVYDPEAKDVLAQVYSLIADCELKMNRPVAARAALQIALHCQPANEQLLQNFEAAFGDAVAATPGRAEGVPLPTFGHHAHRRPSGGVGPCAPGWEFVAAERCGSPVRAAHAAG